MRDVLLYRDTCAKCRFLSRMVTVLSCRRVQRIPLDAPDAEEHLQRFPDARDKLALVTDGGVVVGRDVMLATARRIARAWWRRP